MCYSRSDMCEVGAVAMARWERHGKSRVDPAVCRTSGRPACAWLPLGIKGHVREPVRCHTSCCGPSAVPGSRCLAPARPGALGGRRPGPGARPPRARRPRALEQAAHNWPLQTNVWPEITSPTRGRKRQRSGPTMFAGRIRCCESFLVERIVGTMQRS